METETALPAAARDYINELRKKNRQPSTIRRYRYDLEDFFKWMERENKNRKTPMDWSSLTKEDCEQFIQELSFTRNYSDTTIKRMITVLKQFYFFHVRLGNVGTNPIIELPFSARKPRTLTDSDFLTEKEQTKIFHIIRSNHGLTDHQLKARHLLVDRNDAIITLLLSYGLTLQELVSLRMKHINFEKNSLYVPSISSVPRVIQISHDHKVLLFQYLQTIPKPVRPDYHSDDPVFVAFDFQRNTYRWVYETDQPKALTEIAVQKMIREEVARAALRKGISSQHMRNTCILRRISDGWTEDKLVKFFGFKTPLSLKRYHDYVEQNQTASTRSETEGMD